MEEEARDILRDALKDESPIAGGLGTEIAALFRDIGLEEDLPKLRGFEIKAAEFEE